MKKLITISLQLFIVILLNAQTPALLTEINPGGDAIGYFFQKHIVLFDGGLFFTANDGMHGYELWRTDGTEAGTQLVKDINEGAEGSDCQKLYAADDGTGRELWRSDGTEAGTYMVRDASVNEFANCAKSFAVLDGVLYYGFDDGAHGFEIWRSDGTEAGTYMVKDLRPGSSGSFNNVGSRHIAALGNRLIFAAGYSAPADLEPWISDGTEAGTVLLAELDPGNASSDPRDFFLLGNDVIFTAKTFGIGYELWKMPLLSGVREILRHDEYFQLLPSITDGRFSVAFQDETHQGAFDVALAGITGTVLKTWRSVRPGEELEVYELPAGAYLVRISDGKKIVEVKKLVVVK